MYALTMCFNNMLADGEPQAGAAFVAAAGCIGTVKAFKNAVQVFFFYAYAVVSYFNQYVFVIGFVNTGYDGAIGFAVFGSILYQVDQYLLDLFFIGKYSDWCLTSFLMVVFTCFSWILMERES